MYLLDIEKLISYISFDLNSNMIVHPKMKQKGNINKQIKT